ncbi:hypothetical protein Tco_1488194, partial [Tanacetum coccineum]
EIVTYLRLFQGKDACLDVTGISPFAGMGANSWAPAVALLNAVEKKKKKYASICEDNGYKFIPFAFSTFGEFDKDALDTLLRIKSISIKQSHDEVYGCLKGGSGNSGGKRLAISMVKEAWLSEKEEV